MITRTITRQFQIAKDRGWDRTYWAIDLHGTIIRPNYRDDELPTDFYDHALESMRLLTERPDVKLIMYTCSWPAEIERYVTKFKSEGVHFDHLNKNPDVASEGYGHYEAKPYFNVLLDDKAGFDPDMHWEDILRAMPDIPLL